MAGAYRLRQVFCEIFSMATVKIFVSESDNANITRQIIFNNSVASES